MQRKILNRSLLIQRTTQRRRRPVGFYRSAASTDVCLGWTHSFTGTRSRPTSLTLRRERISNDRLLDMDADQVRFTHQDRAGVRQPPKTMTLDAAEFRFTLDVLPTIFHRGKGHDGNLPAADVFACSMVSILDGQNGRLRLIVMWSDSHVD
jgi:hypothetical protein